MKKFVLFVVLFVILSFLSPIVSATEIIGADWKSLQSANRKGNPKLCKASILVLAKKGFL